MNVSRRHFLQISAAAGLGFYGLNALFAQSRNQTPSGDAIAEGFGELIPDPDGVLDLPEGFRYQIIAGQGERMSDGFFVPGACDGMAAFPAPYNKTLLICNHEMTEGAPEYGPFGENNELLTKLEKGICYDRGKGRSPCLGGTTSIVFDTVAQRVEKQFLSLAGTHRNCAGGPTPWNSWVSCEETVQRAEGDFEQNHGYPFEVPAQELNAPVKAVPLKAMGRFRHEAIAVDDNSGVVYQTEDRGDGLIYRYLSNTPGRLHQGGKLQALAVMDQKSLDTRNWSHPGAVKAGTEFAVTWIDLKNIDAPEDDLRYQGFENGAARFARGEGMWSGNDSIYFACTNGGHAQLGQIWRYTPSPNEGAPDEAKQPGKLSLFVEPNNSGLIDNADNLTVAPWGDLIVCEDGSGEQFLVGITPEGKIYKFARNATPGNSELAGATFSPDGSTLFVNIQWEGLTLAITGPWQKA